MEKIVDQLKTAWSTLDTKKRISLGVSVGLSVAAVLGIVWWANLPTWTVLYTGLEPKDAQAVIQELQARSVKHRVSGNPTRIEVPAERVTDLRLELSALNVAGSDRYDFERFVAEDAITTPGVIQDARKQRALESEIARTVEALDEVVRARVHLVLAGNRVFLDDDDVAKASVTLTLAGGRSLPSHKAQAVASTVAAAVPELEIDNVTVIDTSGTLLWDGGGEGSGLHAARQMEAQAAVEKQINAKVTRVLEPILGADKFVVRTTAEIDKQKVFRKEKNIDPDSGVLISEEKRKQSSSSGGAGGVPGVATNVGGAGASVPTDSTESSDSVSNFEYSVVERTVEEPIGQIKRLSVAVLVDTNWEQGTDADGSASANPDPAAQAGTDGRTSVPRAPEDIRRIEQLVKAAISFDDARGDVVTVEQAPFLPSPVFDAPSNLDPLSWLPLVKYPALIVLALLTFFLFVRPVLATVREALTAAQSAKKEQAREQAELEAQSRGKLENLPDLGAPSQIELARQRLAALAAEQPEGVAQTVRVWLHEDVGQP